MPRTPVVKLKKKFLKSVALRFATCIFSEISHIFLCVVSWYHHRVCRCLFTLQRLVMMGNKGTADLTSRFMFQVLRSVTWILFMYLGYEYLIGITFGKCTHRRKNYTLELLSLALVAPDVTSKEQWRDDAMRLLGNKRSSMVIFNEIHAKRIVFAEGLLRQRTPSCDVGYFVVLYTARPSFGTDLLTRGPLWFIWTRFCDCWQIGSRKVTL